MFLITQNAELRMRFMHIFNLLFLLCNLFLLAGCATVEQTIYLGDVEVNAPICPPPTHININKDVGNVTISPRFTGTVNNTTIIGSTESRYNRIFDFGNDSAYRAKFNNLDWNITTYTFGVDIDYKVSKAFSIFGGFNYSGDGQTELMGGNVGIGFHNHAVNPVVRFDIGITIQEYNYTAITIVHTRINSIFGNDEYWDIFGDQGSSTNINPFGTLTVNSSYDSSFFNWFITGGFFTQNLLGFEPGTTYYPIFPFFINYTEVDTRSDMLAGFLYFNPGVSLSLNREIRILLSTKMNYEVLATNSTQLYVLPAVQIDFQF
jgi:hypothetical protein